jgi:hypothetical protein
MPELMLNSYHLREIADATIGHAWEKEFRSYLERLRRKSEIIKSMIQETGRGRESRRDFIRMCFISRRYADSILSNNTSGCIDTAIESVASADEDPETCIALFARLNGAPAEVLRDQAFEMIHFSFPEKYGLATRWVWNPVRGTGALREAIIADRMEMNFLQIQKVMKNIYSSLTVHGYRFHNFFPIDLISALHYSQDVIGAKDNSMNAGGMEALFPDHGVISMMILGLREIQYANP